MSLFMTDLGAALGNLAMAVGIVVGVPGMEMIVAAYPVHNWVLRKEREKVTPEILRLTDELMR